MVIADELGLHFEFIHVCHCFRWRVPLGQEFGRWAVAQDCVGVGVGDVLDEGDAPQLGVRASPSSEYSCARYRDFCIVGIEYFYLVFVEDRDVVCVDEFGDA